MRLIIEDGQLMLVGDGGIELTRVALEDHADLQAAADVLTDWAVAYRTPEQEREDELIGALIDAGAADVAAEYIEAWSGDGVAYMPRKHVTYAGEIYRVIQAHTSQADWTPDVAVSLYVIAHSTTQDPLDEPPEWTQPAGAHDAYQTGDRVTYNGQIWVSTIDANVWAPDVYGWVLDGE